MPKVLENKSEAASLSLREIVQPILPQLDEVEEGLKNIGQESNGILKESAHYVLESGGKRLRASLVLFCASINSKNSQSAIEIATAVELIHAATLVHDDIIDRSVLRRLKSTVNVQYGEEVAVLLGDFLYARAFEIVAGVRDSQITQWMAEATQKMCEGELAQLKHRYRADLSIQQYLSFIERKTASLIAVSARAGSRLAGLTLKEQDNLASFGLNMGIAYQIVDDLLDIVGSESRIGKTLHTDAGNGKMTLPMILLLQNIPENERRTFLKNFQSFVPRLQKVHFAVNKYKVVEQTEKFAENYFRDAICSIDGFCAPVKKSLEDLSRFILNRDY